MSFSSFVHTSSQKKKEKESVWNGKVEIKRLLCSLLVMSAACGTTGINRALRITHVKWAAGLPICEGGMTIHVFLHYLAFSLHVYVHNVCILLGPFITQS